MQTARQTETLGNSQVVVGLRVVRGPDWQWGNQDAGEGYVGTVVNWQKQAKTKALDQLYNLSGVVSVVWDCGIKNNYRIGYDGAFDLRVVDSSATEVKHEFTSCIECCPLNNLFGIRWHCQECKGSLCSSCFFNDKHDQTHTKFMRYETPNTAPVDVILNPTRRKERIELKGIFKEARVKSVRNCEKGDEDIVDGCVTSIGWLMETRNQAPGMAQVKWQNGEIHPYRLGFDGKVDLQLVKVASGGFYHPEHLPVLKSTSIEFVTNVEGEIKFAIGDWVKICVGDEELKKLQNGHGGYVSELKKLIGKPGIVRFLNEDGVVVVYEGGEYYNLNPEVLARLAPFSNEQPVRIKDDETTIRSMENIFGSKIARKQLADETGRVVHSSHENDQVEVILDSDKNNERRILHRNWIEILIGDKGVSKEMAQLKSQMISVLVKAASCGQHNTVKELLTKYPVEIDAKNDSGLSAFHAACRNGHLEIVKDLYFMAKEKKLPVLEQQDLYGNRAIHHAAEGCHWKVLAFLIKPDNDPRTRGADLNAKDKKNLAALQIAVRAGCLQSVQLLIESGSNINTQDNDGDTALHNAIIMEKLCYRDPEIITALTSSPQINLKLRNNRGMNVLFLSVAVQNIIAFDHLLKVGGEELAAEEDTENKLTVLHLICYNGEYQFVKTFLKHAKETFSNSGENLIERSCKGGFNPLFVAVYRGHNAVVELLIEKGKAKVNKTDEDGDTLVHIVAIKLESFGDEPNPKTSPNIFEIHRELKENYTDTLKRYPGLSLMCYLISKGCPWKKIRTPKASAIINNELIRRILESCESSSEEPTEVKNLISDKTNCLARCVFCPSDFTVSTLLEECGHVTNITCSECFRSRLHRCPICFIQLKVRCEQPKDHLRFLEIMEQLPRESSTEFEYTKEYYSSKVGSINITDYTVTHCAQKQTSAYAFNGPGPSTSVYQTPTHQKPCSLVNLIGFKQTSSNRLRISLVNMEILIILPTSNNRQHTLDHGNSIHQSMYDQLTIIGIHTILT